MKKSPVDSVVSNEEKITENSVSPVAVDNIEDEDEYIEVDELPTIKSDLLRSSSDVDEITKGDRKSPQDVIDDLSTNNNKKYGPKYCKSCDISFNHLSTFIAHKKYYCSSHSSTTSSSLNGAESIVIPTNMATAAHIV